MVAPLPPPVQEAVDKLEMIYAWAIRSDPSFLTTLAPLMREALDEILATGEGPV